MDNRFFVWKDLSSAEVIDLLARFVEKRTEVRFNYLREMFMQTVRGSSDQEVLYYLYLADPHFPKSSLYSHRGEMKALDEQYARLKNVRTDKIKQMPDDATPLLSALFQFVGQPVTPNEPRLIPAQTEHFLINIADDSEESYQVAQHIYNSGLPTSVHIARARDKEGKHITYFHVKDDQERGSGFTSALESGFFSETCIVLRVYEVDDQGHSRLFFYPNSQPAYQFHVLGLIRLFMAEPSNRTATSSNTSYVFAIYPSPDTSVGTSLVNIEFYQETNFSPRASVVHFHQQQLIPDPDGIKHLARFLREGYPESGYRLQLDDAYYTELDVKDETEYLTRLLLEIAERFNEIDAAKLPQPRLYRFGHHQLEALSDILRVYLPENLPQHRQYLAQQMQKMGQTFASSMIGSTDQPVPMIRYLFQANENHQEGWHYLFVDPEVIMHGLDPVPGWRMHMRVADEPVEFWLDPMWTLYYGSQRIHQKAIGAWVFVPFGKRLHPPLHSWGVHSMDDYLRTHFGAIYHGEAGVQRIEDQAIYIFDHLTANYTAESDIAAISIEMLNFGDFKPIDSPEVLGWLNDSLQFLDIHSDTQNLISHLASQKSRTDLLDEVNTQALNAETQMNERAEIVLQEIEQQTHELLALVTEELNRLNTQTAEFATRAKALNDRHKQLNIHYQAIDMITSATERTINRTKEQTNQLVQAVARELAETEKEIERQTQEKDKIITNLEASVTVIGESRKRVEDAIQTLRKTLEGQR